MAYHLKLHNDFDAVGIRILAEISGFDIASTSYYTYKTIDNAILSYFNNKEYSKNDELLIGDICPSKPVAEQIDQQHKLGKRIQLIDHHKTRAWASKYPDWATVNLTKSATELFYRTVQGDIPGRYANFALTVTAWDLWKIDSPLRKRAEELNTLLGFIGKDNFVKEFVNCIHADKAEPFKSIIQYLMDRRDRYVTQVIRTQLHKAKYHMDGFGFTFKILFATDFISDIGNAALQATDTADLHYVCVINPVSDTCSLRARVGGVDISKIAWLLGGGGHAGASGFPFKFTKDIENTIWKLLNSTEAS